MENVHTPLLFLLLAVQVNDKHGLCEGDECDGKAGEDPGTQFNGALGLENGFTFFLRSTSQKKVDEWWPQVMSQSDVSSHIPSLNSRNVSHRIGSQVSMALR